MAKTKAIISDADGTLVDTMYVIRHGQYEASKIYMLQNGFSSDIIPSFEEYAQIVNKVVGKPAKDTIEATFREIYKDNPEIIEKIDFGEIARILGSVQDSMTNSSTVRIYDGFQNLMKLLSREKIKFAIFTSGSPHHIVRNFGIALPELGLQDLYKDTNNDDMKRLSIFIDTFKQHFELSDFTVVTAADTEKHKPDPEGLLLALSRLGVNPEEALVVGDHTIDIESAHNAGVKISVGVTHGFDDRKKLEESHPTIIIDSLRELIEYIA